MKTKIGGRGLPKINTNTILSLVDRTEIPLTCLTIVLSTFSVQPWDIF